MAALELTGSLLVAGCYERFLFGLDTGAPTAPALRKARQRLPCVQFDASRVRLQVFTLEAHQSAVKCLASAGGFIVSGGADDLVRCLPEPPHSSAFPLSPFLTRSLLRLRLRTYRLWDARRDFFDLGFLAHHEGNVNSCALHPVSASAAPSHLLSGGDDGDLVIWSAGSRWDKLKALKAHKGGVVSVAVHPTGKLALSCGRDRGLRLWDLVKGRCVYKTKMATEGQELAFQPGGAAYRCVAGQHVACFDMATGELTATLTHSARLLCSAVAPRGGALLTGGEGRELCAWDVVSGQQVMSIPDAHTTRIRGIAVPWTADDGGDGDMVGPATVPVHVATAGSDGCIKLWDLRHSAAPLSSVDTRARLTCLLACPPGVAGQRLAARSAAVGTGGTDKKKPRARVALETQPETAPARTAAEDREKGTAWWERGEKGPKLSALIAQKHVERQEQRRRAAGVNLKELKAQQQQKQQSGGDGGGKRLQGRDEGQHRGRNESKSGGGGQGQKRPRFDANRAK